MGLLRCSLAMVVIFGGMLDRNGLRPARYLITKNDTMVVASEVV